MEQTSHLCPIPLPQNRLQKASTRWHAPCIHNHTRTHWSGCEPFPTLQSAPGSGIRRRPQTCGRLLVLVLPAPSAQHPAPRAQRPAPTTQHLLFFHRPLTTPPTGIISFCRFREYAPHFRCLPRRTCSPVPSGSLHHQRLSGSIFSPSTTQRWYPVARPLSFQHYRRWLARPFD